MTINGIKKLDSFARQVAQELVNNDSQGGNGNTISGSIWNQFAEGKGRSIRTRITFQNAVSSIKTYLKRQAGKTAESVKQLAELWISQIKSFAQGAKTEPLDTKPKETAQNTQDQVSENEEPMPENNPLDNFRKKAGEDMRQNLGEIDTFDVDTISQIDTTYSELPKSQAIKLAENDPRLEKLEEYGRVKIKEKEFQTDIPYARGNTVAILNFVAEKFGIKELFITSALGTKGKENKYGKIVRTSPHANSETTAETHHNANNPKIDISLGRGVEQALRKSKMFSRVSKESDHLDVQIDSRVYVALNNGYSLDDVFEAAQKENLSSLV